MEIEEILRELDTIFRDILKNENITLTTETTAKDVDGWDSLTNMRTRREKQKSYQLLSARWGIQH